MKMYACIGCFLLMAGSSLAQQKVSVSVHNSLPFERKGEMVEVAAKELNKLKLSATKKLVIRNAQGEEVPYQHTYDDKIIFQADVPAKSTEMYEFSTGTPKEVDTLACGRYYKERLDDIAWENDKTAFRAYGPALQKRGEKAYGYDVFTKSVPYPVVEKRYAGQTSATNWARVRALQAAGQKEKAAAVQDSFTYHVDHGNGMDCYSVGPTLGGGTAALMADTSIVYPYCYKDYEILDNGPLRFTLKLVFNPIAVKGDKQVVETRVITLDAGSHLNRTNITYDNLSAPTPVCAGLVIHPQNPDGYAYSTSKRYIAYADSTDNVHRNNGVVYVGAVFARQPHKTGVQWFAKPHSGALGHVLGIDTYKPGTTFTYYWGSGWSKCGFPTPESWNNYLERYAQCIEHPLTVKIK